MQKQMNQLSLSDALVDSRSNFKATPPSLPLKKGEEKCKVVFLSGLLCHSPGFDEQQAQINLKNVIARMRVVQKSGEVFDGLTAYKSYQRNVVL